MSLDTSLPAAKEHFSSNEKLNPLHEAEAFSLIYLRFGANEALLYLKELKEQGSGAYSLIQHHEPHKSQWSEARIRA